MQTQLLLVLVMLSHGVYAGEHDDMLTLRIVSQYYHQVEALRGACCMLNRDAMRWRADGECAVGSGAVLRLHLPVHHVLRLLRVRALPAAGRAATHRWDCLPFDPLLHVCLFQCEHGGKAYGRNAHMAYAERTVWKRCSGLSALI